jgi:aspartyl-tRNA(Asn)/glutamyl-tRNA(Gln) amidotransferase subunit A
MLVEQPSITTLARNIRAGHTTSASLTEQCLEAIGKHDRAVNAFIAVLADTARAAALEADRELREGRDRGPLHGIPISLKDLIDMAGVPTTAASRVRRHHVAAADAPVTARLREAGAVLIGKTNLHEFAFGTTNEDSAYGPARHPVDPTRSPGGSSGGSAVSVVTGMAHGSIGTDTGGSIRIPAAVCGLVGLKPGLGEIPTAGVVPLSGTMDHVGPITRTVGDARLLYDALRGVPTGPPTWATPVRGLRLGIPRDYFLALLDSEVAAAFDAACERLRAAGVVLDEVAVPHATAIAAVYLHIGLAEAAAYHAASLDTQPGDYTPNVRIRLEMGRYILAEDYVRAMRGREQLRREVDAILAGRDGLLLPAVPIPAPAIGAATVRIGAVEEPVRNVTLRLTQAFNITGHPAIAVPCGTTRAALPIGIQLVGASGATGRLLDVAEALEPYFGPGRSR